MSDIIHTETITVAGRLFTIEVLHDHDCHDPLKDDEGTVFITCNKGARSQYGNTPLDRDAHDEIAKRIRAFSNPDEVKLANALEDEPAVEEPLIGLPVYVYEHGQVAMSARSFAGRAHHAEWDSGQSGFIYITPKTALDWMGGKRLGAAKLRRVYKALADTVEEYGKWCNGETYGYVIRDEDGKEVDSCWGFIGMDYMLSEARAAAKSSVQERKAA